MKFGDRLRQAREARGVTLDAVLAETHIAKRYLHALERSELPSLPGGVFNRGYIRSYAECLDIDPEPILKAYELAERECNASAGGEDRVLEELSLQAERHGGPKRRRPTMPTPWAGALALLALTILVGGVWLLLPERERQAVSQPPQPTEPDAPAGLPSAVVEIPVANPASPETNREASEQPTDVEGPDATRLKVTDAGLGTAIVERALTGRAERFGEGTRVFFWTRALDGEKGSTLRHVWKFGDETVMVTELAIGGPHWRTYSSYTLPPGSAGNWTVEAIGPDGRLLSHNEFVCFAAPNLETRQENQPLASTPSETGRLPRYTGAFGR